MTTTETTEGGWKYELPDTEELCRLFLFAVEEAEEARDYERLVEIRGHIDNIRSRVCRDGLANWEESMSRLMQANGDKSVQVGEIIFKHHQPKTTKCKSNRAVFNAILENHQGDTDKVPDYLASDAWKHGSVKSAVGEDVFKQLFSESRQDRVRIEARDQRYTKG